MASILGDLWQVTDFQRYLGQEVLNVYFYRVTSVTGINDSGYQLFADWFETEIVDRVAGIQNSELNHYMIRVLNLSNGVDFLESPIDVDGAQAAGSSATPSYVSIGYKLIRESLVTRNGYKRYAGLPEAHITGNTWTIQGGSDDLAIADALAADWVSGAVTLLEPVIVKRPIPVPAGTSYDYSSIGAAQSTALGTQNTRKAGAGI